MQLRHGHVVFMYLLILHYFFEGGVLNFFLCMMHDAWWMLSHPIPGSNRIIRKWTGNMQKSDIFAQKYRKKIKNNACTRHLWKNRLTYLEAHPLIGYWGQCLLKKINMQLCQNPVLFSLWTSSVVSISIVI